jgi:hypothetical protein
MFLGSTGGRTGGALSFRAVERRRAAFERKKLRCGGVVVDEAALALVL